MMNIEEIDKLVKMKDKLTEKEKEILANEIINNKKAREIAIRGFISQSKLYEAAWLSFNFS